MFKTRGGCGTPCIRTFLLNYRVHISRTEHLRARHGSRLLLQNTRIPTTRSVVGCKVLIDRAEGGVTPRTRVGSRSVLSLHTVGQSALGLLIIAVTHQPVAGVPTRTTCLPTQFDGIAVGTGTMMVVVFDYCLPSPGHPPGKRRHSWDFVVPSTEVPIAFPKGGGWQCNSIAELIIITQVDVENCGVLKWSRAFTKNKVSPPFVPGHFVSAKDHAVHHLDKETVHDPGAQGHGCQAPPPAGGCAGCTRIWL